MEMIQTKRVALYIRVSTQEQALEGHSIQAQEQNGRQFAERMGYEVVEVYADEGISGKSTKNRFAYQRMMNDARNHRFDLLVIWKLTRLGRNMLDVLQTVEELLRYDVGLHSISEQFDVTTSTGKLMLQLLGSFGEFERNQIAENVQMSMQSLVKDKKRYAGGRRLGYVSGIDTNGQKQLVIEPEEAKIVRLIYAKYLGGAGYRAIANFLNRQGYQTVKKNAFSTTAVKDILRNKIYAGYLEYARYINWETKRRKGKNPRPILVKGTHEPIISEEDYQKVQERLALEGKQPKWNHTGENVLTGLLRCPECGAPMAASNVTNTLKDGTKKRIRYYSCSVFRNKGASVCHANSIRAEQAETFVADRLKEIVQLPEVLPRLVAALNEEIVRQSQPLEQELVVLLERKEELKTKIEKWEAALEDSPELFPMLKDRLDELTEKRRQLHIRENEILGIFQQGEPIQVKDVQRILTNLDRFLAQSEKKQIKALYRTFIEKITFDPNHKEMLEITMKFTHAVVQQLNEQYQIAVSKTKDTAIFVLKTPFTLTI
ncbi:TPA: recombinase family protein [Enterococcus faecium]|uniref:recombinase family protein n=1 Tax=Enterococcus faecium TaxID=1352 RepID=UPI00098F0ADC|nr:recombinase family protein [Enterococcus faecium]AQT57418.1 Putative DNA-invertase from lambdoid prophage Rac [Enterococcus faecium]AQY27497.1 recombinase family protein [Enterococcus faecium]AQY31015.1 recombinase family protein [Enterococcus faecium]MBQ1103693.1 recombinase family protein [Enterococcus faecium]MBQ1125711.1 recombinase family protein [Enterococcus faecium]